MRSLREPIRRSFDRAVAPIVRMSETRANHLGSLFTDVLVGAALVWAGLYRTGAHPGMALLAFGMGLLAFSWVEYGFHRWLMHGQVPLLGPGHRKHHENPTGHDSMPFFLPPMILAVLVSLFALLMPVGDALLLAGGLACGYAAYGLSHAVIHVKRFRHPLGRRWAAVHHVHHYHPDANFGVTTPLWDIVLGTRYVRNQEGTERIKRA
ncbi:sterol desaturase family protein [Thermomonas sp.]|uniref:sterol desaturase family protein n=1 Tax=Thermomonas sp. TaxID=1971895 RepID=UPI00248A1E39|nr:sterol desaturase family protein [Thermomonas sp.]MDI1253065.1 sterol desaturase family protein [Thermomonas sp.]